MKKKIIPIIPIIAGAKEFAPDHMQPDKRKKAQDRRPISRLLEEKSVP